MIGDHFKYKDKQAHLERSNVVFKLKFQVLLYFLTEDGLRIVRNVSK